ncbi:MAG TPA: type II toxin-antitoxin system prevent-host-death family antitoxin [Candidatus Dormibacteraeota bacterium]|jgi:prevent-host-death family protein
MARSVSLDDFGRMAGDLVRAVAADGDTVVVTQEDQPVAVLASHKSVLSMASLVDLPRWEEWLRDMKDAMPDAARKLERLARTARNPEPVEKAALGFDPKAGTVGSEAGRDFLAGELRRLGVPIVDRELLGVIYAAVIEVCEDKETVYEEDLRVIAQEKISEAPQRLKLLTVTVTSTTGLPATAEVTLELGHGPAMRREQGDGPLDAAIKAIEKLTGLTPSVENFSVVAATRGHDAIASAVIELLHEGAVVVGAGASTNSIEAGVHAYVNALNFLVEARSAN